MICVRKRILGIHDFHSALATRVTVVRDRVFAERGNAGVGHVAVGIVRIADVHFFLCRERRSPGRFSALPNGLRVGLPSALLGETNG